MGKIKDIVAREILASGGLPTVEVTITLLNGVSADASISYGLSAGSKEAYVLVDEDARRYAGKGMLKAVENINTEIRDMLLGKDSEDQKELDNLMIRLDGTKNKGRLGGNAILAVSMGLAKVSAKDKGKELYHYLKDHILGDTSDQFVLPAPMMVAIEGGKHADSTTDIQEFCISMINKDMSAKEKVRTGEEVYIKLGKILKKEGFSTNVGNEGAYAPNGITSNSLPFEYITQAIEMAGFTPGVDVGISIDPAASEFFKDGKYHLKLEQREYSPEEMVRYYKPLYENYSITSMEDILSEFDKDDWGVLLKTFPKSLIVADDLTVTNLEIIKDVIEKKLANAVIIKLNQIGTVSETLEAGMYCKQNGIATIFSHRGGGESNDTTMVDAAVAVGSAFIKVGPSRGERVCKYNRLMRIEEDALKIMGKS